MKEQELQPWLIRMSQGDEAAFRFVYEATREHAYRLIYYLAPDKDDAPDLMSEVYMALLRGIGGYKPELPFRSWFNGLIVRQVRNWKRRSWQRFRILEKAKSMLGASTDRSMDHYADTLGVREELARALHALPYKQREVIVLRYYQEYALEEIAQLLRIPIGTVKSRHHHALKQLRGRMELRGEEREATNYVY